MTERKGIIARLWRKAQLRNPLTRVGLILMYHRVIDLPSDPQLLGVTPEHFAEHLQVLRQLAHPLRLTELADAVRENTLRRHSVAITFDDGYADNLYEAAPLLERYEIPATIFVTTGQIGAGREFWWDELDRLLLQPRTLPSRLELRVNGSIFAQELSDAAMYSDADYQRHRDWHVEKQNDPTPRHRLYRSVYQLLHDFPHSTRQKVVDELAIWSGAEASGRQTHRTLNVDELIKLNKSPMIDIGAHTVNHLPLATLSRDAQRDEVAGSKLQLEQILGHAVKTFAYPHGSYTAETIASVREAGFICAASSDPDVVWTNADCYKLPRMVVRDWDRDRFARQLRSWFNG